MNDKQSVNKRRGPRVPNQMPLQPYKPGKPALFYPSTATLLEIILNREPVSLVNIFQWLP